LGWGCSQGDSSIDEWVLPDGKIKVLSTTAIIDDVIGKIGGDRIAHLSLITGEMDPHSYELVKGDDEKINLATLIFCHGLGLEHGASLRMKLAHKKGVTYLGECVKAKNPEAILMRKGQVDPHIWMDVSLWKDVIDPIVKELSKVDPEGASFYEQNGEALTREMLQMDRKIITQLSQIPSDKRFLVTSHDAFNYFTRRYLAQGDENWSCRFQAPEGLAPDGQLSCFDIGQIVDHLHAHQIRVVFPESNVSKDSLKKIISACSEKGLPIKIARGHLHADALGSKGSDADTYLKMMEHNLSLLVNEWQ
jgi:manganese/zinc/iron transport system substrate-binding protein